MEISFTLPSKVNFLSTKIKTFLFNTTIHEESEESVCKCGHCYKVCKSQGGLTLHRRKKHPEVNEINKPG